MMLQVAGGLAPLVLTRNYKHSRVQRPRNWHLCAVKVQDRPDLKLTQWNTQDTIIQPLDKLNIISYSDEEYSGLLQDSEWTREETDAVFTLARDFDLRWIVIADRYPMHLRQRTIEQLQHRYYQVNRLLLTARLPREDPNTRVEIEKYSYDLPRQELRKANLNTLLNRSAELLREEQLLVHELSKFELVYDKWNRTRDYLVKIHADHEMPSQALANALERGDMKKKRPSADSKSTKKREYDGVSSNSDYTVRRDRPPAGVYLRSARMASIKQSAIVRVSQLLEEYNVGQRPAMATEAVATKFEDLRALLQSYSELEKALEKAESDLKAAHDRKKLIQDELSSGKASRANAGTKRPPASLSGTPRETKKSRT